MFAAAAGAALLELGAHAFVNIGWNKILGRAAEARQFFDQARTEIAVLLGGQHKNGFDVRLDFAIHHGHLQFVFVIGDGADAADDDGGAFSAGVVHQKAVENVNLHVVPFEGRGLKHLDAFLFGEQRIFFEVVGDGDNQLSKNIGRASDEIQVAIGDRIEGAGINGGNRLGGRVTGVEWHS